MNKETINSIVLINGGTLPPGNSLLERELYVDSKGNLYCGTTKEGADNVSAPKKINAGIADIVGNTRDFYIDTTTKTGKLGGFSFGSTNGLVGTGVNTLGIQNTLLQDVAIKNATITNSDFSLDASGSITNKEVTTKKVTTSTIKADEVILTIEKSYGTKLPESGTEGQLFFLIQKQQ